MTALHIAARRGCTPIVRSLLDAKCDKNAKERDGFTALHHASRCACASDHRRRCRVRPRLHTESRPILRKCLWRKLNSKRICIVTFSLPDAFIKR